MKTAVLLPVKDPESAKSRLASLLTVEQRCRLAWAMFLDVARALERVPAAVVVVTNSGRAADHSRAMGWRVLWEGAQVSESASVDAAARQLSMEGIAAVLRVPADLPLVQAQDILSLLEFPGRDRSAILVPSRDRMGTNAILRTPPDLFPSRFGHNSFILHAQEALRAGARLDIIENPRIALDIDEPADICRFMARESDTETFSLLRSMSLHEREN